MSNPEHTKKAHQGGWKRGVLFTAIVLVLAFLAYYLMANVFRTPNLPRIGSSGAELPSTTLDIGVRAAPASLDIHTEKGVAIEQALMGNVYEGLLRRNEKNTAEAGIATSWDVSKDALTYTFHLASGAHFSDGSELSAQDAVWSFQQTIEKKYVGADDLEKLASVRAPDDSTLIITVKSPDPELLWKLGGRAGLIFDQDAADATTPLGSGPFTIGAWEKGKTLTLQRDDDYWAGTAAVKTATLHYYSDTAAEVKALEAGTLQAAYGISAEQMQTLKGKGFTTAAGDTTNVVVLGFNNDASSVLSDKRFRQAVRYMIDEPAIISALGGLHAEQGGPLPSLDPGYEKLSDMFPVDPAKGRSLSYYFGAGYYHKLWVVTPDTIDPTIAKMVVEQLRAGGLVAEVKTIVADEWDTTVVQNHDFDLALTLTSESHNLGLYADPSTSNPWTYSTSAGAEEYAKAQSATTEADYEKYIKQTARTVSEEAPADWLYQERIAVAWSAKVTGVSPNMADRRLPLAELKVS